MTNPRPTRLGDVDVHEAVSAVRETPDLWKAYRPEWLITHTARTEAECAAVFHASHAGRIRDEDVRYREHVGLWALELRLPNLKGEFKTRELADRYATEQVDQNTVVVARSSRDEMKLLEYGKRKLVS